MLDEVYKYLDLGWNVIPVWNVRKDGRCGCGSTHPDDPKNIGKHPIVPWQKYQTVRVTREQAQEWWTKYPFASIAVVTGNISRLLVLDDDSQDPKPERFQTVTAQTGSGGMHYFFRLTEVTYRSVVRGYDENTDIKCEGGYVILPPSTHRSGKRYGWLNSYAIAKIPERVKTKLERKDTGERQQRYSEGTRNDALTKEAGRLFGKGLAPEKVLERVLLVNHDCCEPALSWEECFAIVESIGKRENKQRQAKASDAPNGDLIIRTSGYMLEKYGGREVEWLIPEWLPGRTTLIIGAPPETYKTWLSLNLCLSICSGKPFLGRYPTRKGNVLIVQQEDDYTMAVSRMMQMLGEGETLGDAFPFTREDIMPLWTEDRMLHVDNLRSMKQLREVCGDRHLDYVNIDPMYSFLPLGDDYGASGAAKLNSQLKGIRDEFGTTFGLLHHTSRSGTKEEGKGSRKRDSLWGSVFINAGLETAWHLRCAGEGSNIVEIQRHSKAAGHKQSMQLEWHITDWGASVDNLAGQIMK